MGCAGGGGGGGSGLFGWGLGMGRDGRVSVTVVTSSIIIRWRRLDISSRLSDR